jgi:hypothetical protein
MKKILPALLILILATISCKKNKSTEPVPASDTIKTTLPPTGQPVTTNYLQITAVAPTSGSPGTVITLTGKNFGTVMNDIVVTFNQVPATVQSVTDTEIKVIVPVTATGNIVVTKGNQYATGPSFTFLSPALLSAYVSGDVILQSQADVDLFVSLNKGRQLQITGNLTLGSTSPYATYAINDITSIAGLTNLTSVFGTILLNKINLSDASFLNHLTSVGNINVFESSINALDFNNLNGFTGSLTINGAAALSHIKLGRVTNVGVISINYAPKLTDLSFLNDITNATSIALSGLSVTSIAMDKLTALTTSVSIASNNNLLSVNFKNLTSIGGSAISPSANSLLITGCPALSSLDFSSLSSVKGKIALRNTKLTDLSTFKSLQTAGALEINMNAELTSLQGLEHLSSLTAPAVGPTISMPIFNGLYITGNAKLTTLNGLQNLTNLPLANITNNQLLNDFCAMKAQIVALSKLPAYKYTYQNNNSLFTTGTKPALELTKNSSYLTTQDALDAAALCK